MTAPSSAQRDSLRNARANNEFFSTSYCYGQHLHTAQEKRRFKADAKQLLFDIAEHIHDSFQDHLKIPGSASNAHYGYGPSITWESGTNIRFGKNAPTIDGITVPLS